MDPNNTSPSPNMPPRETLEAQPFSAPPVPAPPPQPGVPTPINPVPTRPKLPTKLLALLAVVVLLLLVGVGVLSVLLKNTGGLNFGGGANLVWWGLWEDSSVVQPLIDEYQQSHPGVKIEYKQQSPEDYRERLVNSIAQGDGPDIFRIHNSWLPMFRNSLAPIPSSVISPSDYLQTFYPVVSTDLSLGSTPVAVPLEFDSIGLYINDEIFDTYLKQPPTTWDELRDLAKQLTIKDENDTIIQSGVSLGRTENVDHWPEILALLMIQNHVDMTNPSSDNAAIALDYYTRFATEDGVWNETLPESTLMFAQGKLAMYFAPAWRSSEILKQNPSLRFHVVPVPQLPKSSLDEANTYYATYWAEGVNKDSKSQAAAFEFLKFLVEKETLQKFYQNAANSAPERKFGEPYPRVDMQDLILNDPLVGAFVKQGKEAKSWYLQSRTFDGATGINSQINKYFEDAVNSVVGGGLPNKAVQTAAAGVQQVLAQYGLIKAPAPASK